jgi:hypothetical protein
MLAEPLLNEAVVTSYAIHANAYMSEARVLGSSDNSSGAIHLMVPTAACPLLDEHAKEAFKRAEWVMVESPKSAMHARSEAVMRIFG